MAQYACNERPQSKPHTAVSAWPDSDTPRRAVSARQGQSADGTHAKGIAAEDEAVRVLESKGFAVLHRRYRTVAGEIDLVVARHDALAFVEVKRRASVAQAMEAITPRQQTRIAGAAEIWLQTHPEYAERDMTFDAFVVCPHSSPCHIRDAFRPAM